MFEGSLTLIAIDEEANHQIVYRRRFRKTDRAPDEPLAPGPQGEVFALDFLRVLLAHVMLRWVDVPLGSARVAKKLMQPRTRSISAAHQAAHDTAMGLHAPCLG